MFLSEKVKIKLYPLFLVMCAFLSIPGELYRSWIRNLDGALGQRLRYLYYKKRLRHLGRNVIIDTGVFFSGWEYISIGDNTHIDKNCILVGAPKDLDYLSNRILVKLDNNDFNGDMGTISIGKECHISQNVMIYGYGGVDISDYVGISADSKIYSLTSLPANPYNRSEITTIMPFSGKSPTFVSPVVIGYNCWVGIGCIVQPGITIEENTFVESYSVISAPIGKNKYAKGNPAVAMHDRFKIQS